MEGPIFHLERVVKVREEDLEDFTGPLDLILHLLTKNRMEIKDIQIALILDQYLAWMDGRKRLDLDVASEFVTMAAHLVYIKTRMLLSIHDEEALTEMEQLIATLQEHQCHENYGKIKAIAPVLSERFLLGQDYLVKPPELLAPERGYRYIHDKEDLRCAILDVLTRMDFQLPPPMAAFQGIVGREPYPVADKVAEILAHLTCFGVTHFRTLFQDSRSRSEVVATFLAVLELCKARRLLLVGTGDGCMVTNISGEEDEWTLDATKTSLFSAE